MQLPWKVNIKKKDLVLEVGPGAYPYYRSDIYIDKFSPDEEVSLGQFGGKKPDHNKDIPQYITKNGFFPFKDKIFDYVICSHVLEHVSTSDISLLLSEMQRVAKSGYIEFPSIFYESIYNFDVHLNILEYFDNAIHLLDKRETHYDKIKPFTNIMVKSRKLWKGFEKLNRPLMSIGFEWHDKFPILKVDTQEDFLVVVNKKYFENIDRVEPYDYSWLGKKLLRIKERFYKHNNINLKGLEK